jgi:phage recombination protein Bet
VTDTVIIDRPSPAAAFELPTTGDASQWTDDQKALLDAAGLVVRKKGKDPVPAPRSTVVAFLSHCRRTGLDPIARQIYAIERGGKWGIQVSIDGFRLVAERSRQYAGQVPVQWTADGETWVDVWVKNEPPAAARVGVIRRDFKEVLYAVARFEAYAVYDEEWAGEYPNRRKTGKKTLSEMWQRMHAEQIAKVAEALALRKAFPMDLSGLYTAEEMDQAYAVDVDPDPRPRSAAPSLEPGTRSAQRDPITPAAGESPSDVSAEPVGTDVVDAASVPPGFRDETAGVCSRCGEDGDVFADNKLCQFCDREVAAEFEGQS